jgi:zinc and cadmium transporter
LILEQIVLASVLTGLMSLVAAGLLSLQVLARVVPQLVSLSAGMLLATALLHLMPEALETGLGPHQFGWIFLAGLIGFFALEKLAILRHSHHHEGDGHEHHHGHDEHEAGPGGVLILVGDSIHNFADGLLIAAAFLTDPRLGWLTAIAIATHEIPQEIGDFIVLLNAGYTKRRAILFNLIAGLAAVLGGVLGYFALQLSRAWLPYVIAVAAASFVYIALADLVPDMQRQRKTPASLIQFALMGLGILVIALITQRVHMH